MHHLRANRRIIFAAGAGTAIEYYDFHIYGTAAALVFGQLFFPSESPAAATLYSIMTFGLAFLIRPLGAVIFGHFGDRVGRKSTLIASLLIMGLATLAIAFLPTYATAGWIAPALLCLLRLGQGIGLSGEWAGATLLVVESAPPEHRNFHFAMMNMGAPIGFGTGTAMFMVLGLVLDHEQFMAWGWRIPFLFSALLVVLGLYMRLSLEDSPEFRAAMERKGAAKVPVAEVVKSYPRAVAAAAIGNLANFGIFYMSTTFAMAYATGELGFDRNTFLGIELFAILFAIAGLLIGGAACDRFSPQRVLAVAAIFVAGFGLIYGVGLGSGAFWVVVTTLCIGMLGHGLANCPLGGFMATLFPIRFRYTGVALSFNIGAVIGGALMPIAAQALTVAGYGPWTGILLVGAGLATMIGIALARPADPQA